MWKSKRNVSITYTPLPPSSSSALPQLNDLVTYQTLSSSSAKPKTIEGIDTASAGAKGGEWDWRGKGWLKIASSHWEVLGWGTLVTAAAGGEEENQWVVTYFAKTMFTPAGIDVYSRLKAGVGEEIVGEIRGELARSGDVAVRKLAEEIFEVVRD
ncbi:MAG: hypothetical protein L6R40_000118 [Gallowayella cf. fulva]|nr:MAG: hypothetical protein L6R40_000118 [Xanthomendoza cf. fulva]